MDLMSASGAGTPYVRRWVLWKQLIAEREWTSVCWASVLKIQFNGIGGLLTYISLTPNADVSALGSCGEAQCRNFVL
jgi:hypothetical protein